ncbi:MAG: hypothetical protein PVH29_01195 [Candidatus Zixiibacteriota bacterium]
MKKRYDKPSIGSQKVFSMTSQSCMVNQPSPGVCGDGIKYEGVCDFHYKIRNAECPDLGWPPVPFS